MAIKIKGKLPLKICSVLFVLYGAASPKHTDNPAGHEMVEGGEKNG